MSFFDFMSEIAEQYRRYRDSWRDCAKTIKEIAKEFFGADFVKLCVFGSTVKGNWKPLSDIDVAVILKREADEEERVKFRLLVKERIGRIHPFEIHIVSERVWEDWYMKFVKDECIEV